MANRDNPHGLRPLMRTLGGGYPTVQMMQKDASEGAAIFMWDAVNREADGNIEANSATPGTTKFSGVSLNHGAASTLTNHVVITSPSAVFEAQDNNDTDGFTDADMGLNVNIELNAGSSTTKISGHELDESTANTTATLDLKMLQLLQVPDNAAGAWSRVEVIFANHRMASATAGV
jgi:hypothetical protein